MCDEIATESGLSKAPRETARYSGQRSNVNDTVDPHRGQKWTWTIFKLLSERCWYVAGLVPENDTASMGYIDSA